MAERGANLGATGVELHQLRLVVPDAVVDGDGILPRNCHRDALRVMLHIAEPTTVAMRVLGAVNTSAFGLSAQPAYLLRCDRAEAPTQIFMYQDVDLVLL